MLPPTVICTKSRHRAKELVPVGLLVCAVSLVCAAQQRRTVESQRRSEVSAAR